LANAANAINATLYEKLDFNFMRDIARVAGVTSIPVVLVVNPSFRVKTVPELIAYAKANPGKITMASPFSARPTVAPTKLEDLKQRDQQLEPLRAEQRKAIEKRCAAQARDRIRSATSGANSINKSSTQLWLTLDP
jgi:hypothetical protein